MDCLLHQVLAAMLTVTPVPDGAQFSEAQARPAVIRSSDIKPAKIMATKKGKTVAVVARSNGTAVN